MAYGKHFDEVNGVNTFDQNDAKCIENARNLYHKINLPFITTHFQYFIETIKKIEIRWYHRRN